MIAQQTVNWNKHHITGKDLQPEKVQAKYDLWDQADKNQEETYQLLKDPTIYEYAFFKDEEGKPFKYAAYQDLIINEAKKHDFTPDNPNRYLLFQASNQIGKSRTLRGYARYLINTKENINIVFISNNLKSSQFLLAELKNEFNNSSFSQTWTEDVGETSNTTMLTFERTIKTEHGSRKILNRIICAPAGEGALGYPIHYLFLDEADFYEDGKRLFWKVFFPRTKKTKGQIILFSNPNPDISPQESILEQLWQGDLFAKKFHFNFLDAPWNTKEEFERDKLNSPQHIFESTHLGIRSDLAGSFFTSIEIQAMLQKQWENRLPITEQDIYIGIDLGKMNDQTVISIGTRTPSDNSKYDNLEVKYLEELPLKTPYDKILERLQTILAHYQTTGNNIGAIAYDATGQKTFGDFLTREGIHATPIDFSKKETNKTRLYNDFKLLAEQNKIKIVYHPKAEKQLAGLHFSYTDNKRLKVAHRTEAIHDDFCDSIAILAHVAVCPHTIPVTATIVEHIDPRSDTKTAEEKTKELQERREKDIQNYLARTIKTQSLNKRNNNYF